MVSTIQHQVVPAIFLTNFFYKMVLSLPLHYIVELGGYQLAKPSSGNRVFASILNGHIDPNFLNNRLILYRFVSFFAISFNFLLTAPLSLPGILDKHAINIHSANE